MATAKRTYRQFEKEGLTTPEKILSAGWDQLVGVLDSGGYARYDFSTATTLLGNMKELKEKCGSLEEFHGKSTQPRGPREKATGIQKHRSGGRQHIPERIGRNLEESKTEAFQDRHGYP